MKKLIFALLVLTCYNSLAQSDSTIVVKKTITETIYKEGNIYIVQTMRTDGSPLYIELGNTAGLMRTYKTSKDYGGETSKIYAVGKCQLIKGDYVYYGMKMIDSTIVPKKGDGVAILVKSPNCYKGLLFTLSCHNIVLQKVDETFLFNDDYGFHLKSKDEEDEIIKKFVSDINYTGTEMKKLIPEQNKIIEVGRYKGQKIFDAMQITNDNDMREFLKYIQARPINYACATWKISEIYATWLQSGAPTVISQ